MDGILGSKLVGAWRGIIAFWAAQLRQGREMPWLLCQEPSAQHYMGEGGAYLGTLAKGTCRKLSESEKLKYLAARMKPFYEAVAEAQLQPNVVAVVPTYWPSSFRQDEKGYFKARDFMDSYIKAFKKKRSIPPPDCTHWCECSSIFRLWNSMLLSLLATHQFPA